MPKQLKELHQAYLASFSEYGYQLPAPKEVAEYVTALETRCKAAQNWVDRNITRDFDLSDWKELSEILFDEDE